MCAWLLMMTLTSFITSRHLLWSKCDARVSEPLNSTPRLEGLPMPPRVDGLLKASCSAYHFWLQGLGKTAQSIATLAFQKQFLGVTGPHIVIAPLTTLGHWQREIQTWTDMVGCPHPDHCLIFSACQCLLTLCCSYIVIVPLTTLGRMTEGDPDLNRLIELS